MFTLYSKVFSSLLRGKRNSGKKFCMRPRFEQNLSFLLKKWKNEEDITFLLLKCCYLLTTKVLKAFKAAKSCKKMSKIISGVYLDKVVIKQFTWGAKKK